MKRMLDDQDLMYFRSLVEQNQSNSMYKRHSGRVEYLFDVDLMSKKLDQKLLSILPPHRDMRLTSLSQITSLPLAKPQPWHRDQVLENGDYSYNILFPVTLFPEGVGFTEIVPRSHNCGPFKNSFRPDVTIGARKLSPFLSLGDVLIADQTILHRGGANKTEQSRPLFVLNYATRQDTQNYSIDYLL